MNHMNKTIIKNISQIATPEGKTALHGSEMNKIKIIEHAAIYIEDGIIKDLGTEGEVLQRVCPNNSHTKDGNTEGTDEIRTIDAGRKCVIPGFVDSHTHFIFAGYRPDEFVRRLQGTSYMEIMNMGGGISSTVKATRNADKEHLYDLGKSRIQDMLSQGITTIEGKSGYGLDFDTENRMLEVMEDLNRDTKIDIGITYLGAHAVAEEYKGDADSYIDFMIAEVLPVLKDNKAIEFVDAFCEDGVFDLDQTKRLLEAAGKMGFHLKMHADEIVPIGGAELAATLGCTSADHLLAASDTGIEMLSKSDTVATLLSCTAFCLGKPYANARKMIDAGCAVALASDFNPGSCFTQSIPLLAALGAIQMKMTPPEVLCALTLNGAAAINRADRIGSIEIGKKADLNILKYEDYRFLIYNTAANTVDTVIKNGDIVAGEGREME